jgi:uncharacterized protein
MGDWRQNLLEDDERILDLMRDTHRIAVLGIKTERQKEKPAFSVPRYLQQKGYEIVPVPVYYPEVAEILGQRATAGSRTSRGRSTWWTSSACRGTSRRTFPT